MNAQNRARDLIASDDVEERGSLAERVLFWLLKHPYQRVSDLAFVFQVHASTIRRQFTSLVKQALVESVTSAISAPNRLDVLYYLTTHGIERVADLVGGADPAMLAGMWQVHESALLRLLPRLHSYLPLQAVIHGLIADAPRLLAYPGGHPAAIRWHWQRDYIHTFQRGNTRMTCRADGAVVFRRRPMLQAEMQEDRTVSWYCFLLLIDPGFCGSEDLHLIRERLEHMLRWRESPERWSYYRAFPPLLVLAPTHHQRDLWVQGAQEAAAYLRMAPLTGACSTLVDGYSPWRFSWQLLDGSGSASLQALAEPLVPQALPPGLLAPKQVAARGKGGYHAVAGNFATRAKLLETSGADLKKTADFSLLSLRFCHRHVDLLQQIYALPLIAPRELAALLRMEVDTLRRYLYDLHHFSCLETMATVRGKRLVLTEAGLRLIALMLGVPLVHVAERVVSKHWQQRGVKQAERQIEHTAGIYTFLAQLQQQAWKLGQELLWWETSRSVRRYRLQGRWHNLMPDALLAYQAEEESHAAWLEWDTGSMHRQPLTVKFEAYAQYVRSHQYRREHLTPPKLLLVAPQNGREQAIRHVAASVLGTLPLVVWTTTEPLLRVEGPLSMIWKKLGSRPDVEEEVCRSTWVEQHRRQ